MIELPEQPPKTPWKPYIYLQKVLSLQYLQKTPQTVIAISSTKCALFYPHYALILNLSHQTPLQKSQCVLYPFTFPIKYFNIATFKEGFVIQTRRVNYLYNNNIQTWSQYYSSTGSNTYSQIIYFPDSGFIGELVFQNWDNYIVQFKGKSSDNMILFNEYKSQHLSQSDDSSVMLVNIDFQLRQMTFMNILTNETCIIDIPSEFEETSKISQLFMVSLDEYIIVMEIYTVLTLFKYRVGNGENGRTERLMGFPDSKKVLFKRRCKQRNLLLIQFCSTHTSTDKYMVYDYKSNVIIKEYFVNKGDSYFPFSPQIDLIVRLDKGMLREEQEEKQGQKKEVDSKAKLIYWQLASRNKIFIDLIVKSGIQRRFGREIIREVLKALN